MINIVGLGYGEIDDLTIKTYKILKESKNIYIKNTDLKIIKSLEEEGILFKNSSNLFKDIRNISKNNEVVYATIGSPSDNDKSVKDIIKLCKEKNIDYKIYPAAGIKELIQSCLNKTIEDITIINSNCIEEADIRKHSEVVIKDISSKDVALKIKTKLENVYDKDIKVYYIINKDRKCLEIKLNKIDDITDFSEFNIIYIPKNSKGKKDIDDLIEIVKILRGENGCPWDKEQTHESIKRDIIEESYEVFDAIEQNNKEALIEELGDVLFQVIFHASLGIDDSEFDMLDITDGISNKMIYRHPHVFGDINVKDTAEVLVNWDELKKGEKHFETLTDELNGVAKAFPALLRAKKIQKKAKKVGFDWDNVEDAIEKIKEELNEVIDVYKSENMVRIKEEIGDLLFSCVNVSRFLSVDAEDALNSTTDKFIKRFSYMEKKSKENNLSLESMKLDAIDKLWDEAKKLEKKTIIKGF